MTYATYENKCCPLHAEFGENLARKWFGDDVVESLPRYVKGDKKGKIKGLLQWEKVSRGGWSNQLGGVVYPNTVYKAEIVVGWKQDKETLYKLTWDVYSSKKIGE